MKTKFLLSFLLLSQILAVSGCARQESPDIAEGSVPAAVSVAEPEGPPDTAEETESWINHYYNRGIYYMDGYTYRQFPDGLYRRKKGTENWELLRRIHSIRQRADLVWQPTLFYMLPKRQ